MKAAILLLLALSAAGQVLTMSTAGTAYPGDIIPVSVALTGSAGANIGSIQFLAPASTFLSWGSSPVGAASTAAHKALFAVMAMGSAVAQVYLVGFSGPSGPVVKNLPYADGPIANFVYQVPAAAPAGVPLTLSLQSAQGITTSFDTVSLGSPSLTIPVGVTASCLASIQSSIKFFLGLPSKLGLEGLQLRIKSAAASGTCQ